ncbi:hypothetical protein HYR99_32805, partial [Candidatus Poribacteria bacterium]|nr:hypothetical protein [Candidatus Poribacteria bacterium]
LPISFKPPMAPTSPLPPLLAGEGKGERFDLRLSLTSELASDVTTTLGTHPDAQMGADGLDASEPPTLGGTVAVYFDHPEWGDSAGLYNTDYQPPLAVGEQRTWRFTVFSDQPNAQMLLSWEAAIAQVPADIMLYFRPVILENLFKDSEWQDMRLVRSVDVTSHARITQVEFEVRAERFGMSPPSDVQVVAGEKRVELRWKADDNPFIEGYTIQRRMEGKEEWKDESRKPARMEGLKTIFQSSNLPVFHFVDTDVEEDATYAYQVSVRFKSGAELKSDPLTITVLPVIKETALRQNYLNPFNPETWIPYELATDAGVEIEIYAAHGQFVRTLDLGFQKRGRYLRREKAAYWDGRNAMGEQVASGVYFYILKTGRFTATRKMVILK